MQQPALITPNWDAPDHIVAFTTTTAGGVSTGDCATFNLGMHVGDTPAHVEENRARLQQHIGRGKQLCWLQQTHSDIVMDLQHYTGVIEADAAVSAQPNKACVVMTADCLPVLLCNTAGTKVAALHCGWKGLYHNLITKTLSQHFAQESVIAWLGPAIGQRSYEVDDKLYQQFTHQNSDYAKAFIANRPGHYLLDLYTIAQWQLNAAGIGDSAIFGGEFDTFTDERFFSYRRSPNTGRIASVIYRDMN